MHGPKNKIMFSLSIETHNGSRGIAPLILNLGTGWRFAVKFTSCPPYLRERTPVPIEQEAGWASEPVWTFWSSDKFEFDPRTV